MTVPNTAQQLFNAARNFKALAGNLALIESDGLNEKLVQGLDRLLEILRASEDIIQKLTETSIIQAEPPAETEGRSDLRLDLSKLEKAIAFSEKVLRWMESVDAESIPGQAKAVLKELGTAVMMTEGVVEALVREYRDTLRAGIRTSSSQGNPELILAHSQSRPLLEEWQGQFRLNDEAKKLLHEFLDLSGFQQSQTESRKWERNAERWLLSTPKGMILILRLGSYGDQSTIVPKYLPKIASTENS